MVRELGQRVALDGFEYGVAWLESPDMRGIDCALLYRNDKKGFKLLESRPISIVFPPEDSGYTSRDILYVRGRFPKMKKDLNLFVNHWPSRRGGEQESEPKRVLAARTLRAEVDQLRMADPVAQIIIMGDFND